VLYSDTECVSQRLVAERENVESVESCQVQCDVTEACNAFTYNPDTNMCFLVPECTSRVVDPGRTSGVETSMGELSGETTAYHTNILHVSNLK
jgi:hypothetical protein